MANIQIKFPTRKWCNVSGRDRQRTKNNKQFCDVSSVCFGGLHRFCFVKLTSPSDGNTLKLAGTGLLSFRVSIWRVLWVFCGLKTQWHMIYRIATLRAFTALPWLSISFYIYFLTILCLFLSSFSARLERHEVSRTQSETRTGLCAERATPEPGGPAVGMAGNWQVGGSVMLHSPRARTQCQARWGPLARFPGST